MSSTDKVRTLRRPRGTKLTRISLLFAGCLVAALGFACSSRNSTSNATDAANHSSAADSGVLLAAATRSTSSDTVHLKLNISDDGGATGSQQVTGTGAVSFPDKQASLDLKMLGMTANVVTDNSTFYVQSALLGDDWYRLDADTLGQGLGSQFFASGLIDPAQQFALIKQASSNVTEVGTEAIDGESTTHYRATVDLSKAAADEGASAEDIQRLKDMGVDQLPVDVWVNNDGQVARIAAEYTAGSGAPDGLSGGHLTMTVDYFDYGKPADIQVPPANQVKDFSSSNLGQLFGAASGAGQSD